MAKIAVLFAGQGAQKTGMGKSLYENVDASRAVFDAAEQVMPGITQLCFEGNPAELNKTENTQPCVFTVDMAAYAAFAEAGLVAEVGAGFSLGEYAALAAAGVLEFEAVLKLVIQRAGWMQQAAAKNEGGMAAVLGKSAAEVEAIVQQVSTGGLLLPVNYNCPGQTVVAGDEPQLANLVTYTKENKIKCMRLPVSGAFHTQQMQDATESIYSAVQHMEFAKPSFSLYANKTAQPYEAADMKRVLAEQTSSPVLFEQTVRNMLENGFDTFVEVGPGNTLTGFVKRISKDVATYNINDYDSLLATKEALA